MLRFRSVPTKELGVMFKYLRVVGLGASTIYQPTLGSKLNPLNVLDRIKQWRSPATRDLLYGFEGVVKPGEMLLVLGRPGAGCSTFLRVLANQHAEFHSVQGDIHYDSLSPQEVHRHYRGDIHYCSEEDYHFPTLTVDQTLRFAARTRTPKDQSDSSSPRDHTEKVAEHLETTFGLRHVRNTVVGDAAIRGISGGEKKRVSICEGLATRSLISCWDNTHAVATLSASTALEFVRSLRSVTDHERKATIVSLQQAGEPLFELFDKVCLIYEGRMAYFGPASRARQYFVDMGYLPTNRQTTADFLVAVTDPDGRKTQIGFDRYIPQTAHEFAGYYGKSDICPLNKADIEAYGDECIGKPHRAAIFQERSRAENSSMTGADSPYLLSLSTQAWVLLVRRLQLERGALRRRITQLIASMIQAIMAGSVYAHLHPDTSSLYSRSSVVQFALVWVTFTTSTEIPALFSQRPIVLKHFRAAMYHPLLDSLSLTLLDIPITLFTTGLFSVIIYFLADLHDSFGRFITFTLVLLLITFTMKGLFRAVATSFKSPAPAQALAGLIMMFSVLYMGFILPMPTMIGALKWITYINPLKYATEAVTVNEFEDLTATCSTPIPQGPGYEHVASENQVCTTVGSLPGDLSVSGARYLQVNFDFSYDHLWRNVGILIAFFTFFTLTYLLMTEIRVESASQTSVVLFKKPTRKQNSQHRRSNVDTGHEASTRTARGGTFSFENLSYSVPTADGARRELLQDVSGCVTPGSLVALMGESGAGKTTLLNVLSKRTTTGDVTGDLLLDGKPVPADFQTQIGFCQQVDTHYPLSTVREALLFSVQLRQSQSVPLSVKMDHVAECITMCGLESYSDAIIGTLGIEQLRRVSIAIELIAKPPLLFLDEPTSGLDSQGALSIVGALRNLADKGQAIVCTIHQPSSDVFEMFDHLLLLRKGGQVVYHGELGTESKTIIDYFEKHGARPCTPDENPADYILNAIGASAISTLNQDWHEIWVHCPEARKLHAQLDAIRLNKIPLEIARSYSRGSAVSWRTQLATLLNRNLTGYWRNPTYLLSKFILTSGAGIVIGLSFLHTKDNLQGTQNQLWTVYLSTYMASPLTHQMFVPLINVRNVYELRERFSNMYHWTALLTSQLLAELPWNILAMTAYFISWYWTVGFPTSRAGYSYLMLAVVYPLYFTTVGQAVGAFSPTPEAASLGFSALFAFMLLFDGVMRPYAQLGWWQWMNRVIPSTYVVEGIVGQASGGMPIHCDLEELVTVDPPAGMICSQYLATFAETAGGYLTNANDSQACGYCPYRTKDIFFTQNFSISYSHRWRDFGVLIAYILINVSSRVCTPRHSLT
ncbi:hypothetical protein POSPLADRAFT_1128402 [Postia placenta MAD-698-R-SB12]|uniref:ABC transporter domain-containing protein n=1 Tax=Postia placenta MAD-698-R-SB12 TaxID=670580 RepID=A0A1X6NDS1_9APHY|nr:hypothetical protein POSPLADRAFT_1128402 [Postia placenta MAD-698-R-SB12]OSX66785.1 hypothetical protein POSPLADRAFT_1128402 [Postia placenta MAD-698-R-SB12]